MAITLICPNLLCRGLLQVPDNVRGRKVRCGRCGKDFLVPIQGTTLTPAPPPPAEAKPDAKPKAKAK